MLGRSTGAKIPKLTIFREFPTLVRDQRPYGAHTCANGWGVISSWWLRSGLTYMVSFLVDGMQRDTGIQHRPCGALTLLVTIHPVISHTEIPP